MPVWGLSALAAGSISASLSDSGQAEVNPRAAPALADDTPWQGSSNLSLMTPSVPPKPTIIAGRSAVKAADAHGVNVKLIQKGRRLDMAGQGGSLAQAVIGKPAVTAAVSVAAVKAVTDVPVPSTVANGRAIAIVDVLQVAPTNAPTNMMAAASVALPKISSDMPVTGSGQTRNRAIYGTSANNAYKVYFPQAEYAPPARGDDLVEASAASAQEDARVLKKRGSYLFYEDQPERPSTAKIKEILKANGAGSAKGVVDAIVNAGKNAETRELTAPVLEKVPLNFGDRSLEGSPQKANSAPAIPIGQSNAG